VDFVKSSGYAFEMMKFAVPILFISFLPACSTFMGKNVDCAKVDAYEVGLKGAESDYNHEMLFEMLCDYCKDKQKVKLDKAAYHAGYAKKKRELCATDTDIFVSHYLHFRGKGSKYVCTAQFANGPVPAIEVDAKKASKLFGEAEFIMESLRERERAENGHPDYNDKDRDSAKLLLHPVVGAAFVGALVIANSKPEENSELKASRLYEQADKIAKKYLKTADLRDVENHRPQVKWGDTLPIKTASR
jgi:hypothetical protein